MKRMFACLILTISLFGCFIYLELVGIRATLLQLVDTLDGQFFSDSLRYVSIFEILSLVVLVAFPVMLVFLINHRSKFTASLLTNQMCSACHSHDGHCKDR